MNEIFILQNDKIWKEITNNFIKRRYKDSLPESISYYNSLIEKSDLSISAKIRPPEFLG